MTNFETYLKYKSSGEMMSKYFSRWEMIYSNTAIANKIPNIPNKNEWKSLIRLTNIYLDSLREYLGVPLKVSVGFRNVATNKLVGGVSSSAHLYGAAADLICSSLAWDIFKKKLIESIDKRIVPVPDQVIIYNSKKMIHFGICAGKRFTPRGELLDGDNKYALIKNFKQYHAS